MKGKDNMKTIKAQSFATSDPTMRQIIIGGNKPMTQPLKQKRGGSHTDELKYQLNSYVITLRNPLKKDYAKRYAEAKLNPCDREVPRRGLSFMAAQAVRLNIEEIFQACEQL